MAVARAGCNLLLTTRPLHRLLHCRGKRTRPWQLGADASLDMDQVLDGGVAASPAPARIVQAGAAVLRGVAADVPPEMFGGAELRAMVATMLATMRAAPGVGLAAPQIGIPYKVIVLEDRPEYMTALPDGLAAAQQREPFGPLVVVNPRLRPLSPAGARFTEGCLSVPGYQALVERYTSVEVEGVTEEGAPLRLQAHGWQARILQHECDHVQGILYVDRMLSRSFAARGSKGPLPGDVPPAGPCTCCHPIDRLAPAPAGAA